MDKLKIDNKSIYDEQIPLAWKMAEFPESFEAVVENLMILEKQARMDGDVESCCRLLIAIVSISFHRKNWTALNENIVILSKKPNQPKMAFGKLIQECMQFLDRMPTLETRVQLIETLRSVTQNRFTVEVEYARLTKMLGDIKRKEGKVSEAAELLGKLQVESYEAMSKKEKVEILLNQIQLYLEIENHAKAEITAKRISLKMLEGEGSKLQKIEYYNLMIVLDQDKSFMRTSRHYQVLFEMLTDTNFSKNLMVMSILYCVMAPYDSEKQDRMERLRNNPILDKVARFKGVLALFLCKELLNLETLKKCVEKELKIYSILDLQSDHGKKCVQELENRIIEHNIRIISMYFSRIYLTRMSDLVDLPHEKCESYIAKMIGDGVIQAKIDRIQGIVDFRINKSTSDVLNNWIQNINEVMSLVHKTVHLIEQEECQQNNF